MASLLLLFTFLDQCCRYKAITKERMVLSKTKKVDTFHKNKGVLCINIRIKHVASYIVQR